MDDFDNMSEMDNPTGGLHFVNYTEGIYVGYRFYETAYAEQQAGNMDFDYDSTVLYPFGYGLSYTSFEQKISNTTKTDDGITIEVSVTNTGTQAGRDAVELYYTPPYTNGGIEKSAVNLLDFAKTDLLQPGESQSITFTVVQDDMASFDTYGHGCYVLEAGSYELSIRSDAHNIYDAVTYPVEADVVYDESNPRASDQTAAVNQLTFVEGGLTYLSRQDGFANYAQTTAAPSNFGMPEEYRSTYYNHTNYDPSQFNNDGDEMPTTGAENGVTADQLRGLAYDDALWDKLLDQLTVQDMVDLIALGGYQTTEIASIGLISTTDNDGPATIYN